MVKKPRRKSKKPLRTNTACAMHHDLTDDRWKILDNLVIELSSMAILKKRVNDLSSEFWVKRELLVVPTREPFESAAPKSPITRGKQTPSPGKPVSLQARSQLPGSLSRACRLDG
jgi:hypothetical protein